MGHTTYLSIPPRPRSAVKAQAPPPIYGSVSTFYPDELRLSATGIAVPVIRSPESVEESAPVPWEDPVSEGEAVNEVVEPEEESIEINRKMFITDNDGVPGNGADDMISEASDEEQIALDVDDVEEEGSASGAKEAGEEGAAVGGEAGEEGSEGRGGESPGTTFPDEEGDSPESGARRPPTYWDHYLKDMQEKQQELNRLMGDTPLIRLRNRERQAEKFARAQDPWSVLRLRQEALGMARLITDTYGQASSHPLLVSSCMFRLSQAYFEVKYMAQTAEHAKRALESLPPSSQGFSDTKRKELVREINCLLGESLLRHEVPKPQAALQYLMVAAGGDDVDLGELDDLGLKALISQCHGLMAQSKLKEAVAQKQVRIETERQIVILTQQLERLDRNSIERPKLQAELTAVTQRVEEERSREKPMAKASLEQVETAQNLLTDVAVGVEEKLKAALTQEEYEVQKTKNTLLSTLMRRGAELLNLEARLHELLVAWKKQFRCFSEILSIQTSYQCLSPEVVARAHRSKGACLVRLKRYDEALEEYGYLQELQDERYKDDDEKRELAEAEVDKLRGDVMVAMKDFDNAKSSFLSAQDKYVQYLGEDSQQAWDLAERLQQLEAYVAGSHAPSTAHGGTEGADGEEGSGNGDEEEGDAEEDGSGGEHDEYNDL